MARETATKWILGILIYFVVLIFIFIMADNFVSEYGLQESTMISSENTETSLVTELTEGGYCDVPRRSELVWGSLSITDQQCSRLPVFDQQACESVAGCAWTTESTFLFFFKQEVPAYCGGSIDINALGHEGIILNMCQLPNINNAETCESLGCTYYTSISEMDHLKGLRTVWNSIRDIFTFQFDFGFEETFLNVMLIFFMLYLPLILLIISLYIMVR